ncbi:MAG: hypothetical protein JNN05_11805, partial [Candidatus Omnitrophica bacterium]|nr:hypothetical protein [Candidatus Omnitrophota bacterium]
VDSLAKVLADSSLLLEKIMPYLTLVSLYLYNFFANDHFRQDKKVHATSLCAGILIALCFYFAYVTPNRFMLDLNLIRNEQFLRFFLLGYLVVSAVRMIQIKNLFWAVLAAVVLVAGARQDFLGGAVLNFCVALMIVLKTKSSYWKKYQAWMYGLVAVLIGLSLWQFSNIKWAKIGTLDWNNSVWLMVIPFVYALITKLTAQVKRARILLLLMPVLFMIAHYTYFHYQYVQVTTKGGGFWQLQRNWEDMQRYVKLNTPKDAMLLIPYNMEMCGFRIQSERKIVVSYRDCGIVGFDYMAAKEWQKRIADSQEFRVFTDPRSIGPAVINALTKYQVDYIVFMRYYAPGDNPVVKKVYENEVFALYEVVKKR